MNTHKGNLIRSTKRNKGLEPIIGKHLTVGYDPEIHGEESLEFSYKLPLGAIKRLAQSYFQEIEDIDAESAYFNQSGSAGLRMYSYANQMLKDLEKQLNKHQLPGKKILDEVFNTYFKNNYEKMNRYQKNHPNQGIDEFKRCKDPKCCLPLTIKQKIQQLLHSINLLSKTFFGRLDLD